MQSAKYTACHIEYIMQNPRWTVDTLFPLGTRRKLANIWHNKKKYSFWHFLICTKNSLWFILYQYELFYIIMWKIKRKYCHRFYFVLIFIVILMIFKTSSWHDMWQRIPMHTNNKMKILINWRSLLTKTNHDVTT